MAIQILIVIIVVGLLCMVLPFAAFFVLKARLGLRWGVFGIGALTFLVSQVVLRLPWQIPLAKAALANGWNVGLAGVIFGLSAAVTAGLFEETGRYFAYRWFVKRPTKGDAIALGLGHAGFESVALVGVSSIATGVIVYLASHGLLQLPSDQAAALQPLLDKSASTAWYVQFVVLLERASAISCHVAMSVLVYVAYVRRRWLPYLGALAIHVVMDASAALLGNKHLWLVESILMVVAILSLWGLVRFWREDKSQ